MGEPRAAAREIDTVDAVNERVVTLSIGGIDAIPANRWKSAHFQPHVLVLEYRYEYQEWTLKRAEATGPVVDPDKPSPFGGGETHIYAWLTPLRPTLANPGGVPEWVTELGLKYMPDGKAQDG